MAAVAAPEVALAGVVVATLGAAPAAATEPTACTAFRAEPVVMSDPALCAELEKKVRWLSTARRPWR